MKTKPELKPQLCGKSFDDSFFRRDFSDIEFFNQRMCQFVTCLVLQLIEEFFRAGESFVGFHRQSRRKFLHKDTVLNQQCVLRTTAASLHCRDRWFPAEETTFKNTANLIKPRDSGAQFFKASKPMR